MIFLLLSRFLVPVCNLQRDRLKVPCGSGAALGSHTLTIVPDGGHGLCEFRSAHRFPHRKVRLNEEAESDVRVVPWRCNRERGRAR